MSVEKKDFIYEGKAKQVYSTTDENLVIIHYKDDATAGNGAKKGTIVNKGVMNNKITAMLFRMLEKNGIKTHLVDVLNDRDQLCQKVKIFPLEVIVRNVIAGSMAARVGIPEGTKPTNTIFEICYKNDAYGDPLINDHHAVALGLCTYEELAEIYRITGQINNLLKDAFDKIGITLVDFKIEFGKNAAGEILLADNDSQKDKYVTFKSGNEYFGIKIEYVNEIIVYQEITEIPETEEYIKGLINLRGKIIPVIDVRIRFKQEPFEYNDRTCIIVLNVKELVVGLIVEKIAEVVEITEGNILPNPKIGKADRSQNKYVYGIGKVGDEVKLLLDPERLLNDEDTALIEQVNDMNADETEDKEE